jgi:hypothetical protein
MGLGVLEHVQARNVWQRQIQQQHIDGVRPELLHGFTARARFGHHREIRLSVDQGFKAGANNLMVVDYHDSGAIHGPGSLHNLLSYLVHGWSLHS